MKGGCLCGAVRYEAQGAPLVTAVCHCTHCQKTSGSAFTVNAMVPGPAFSVTGPVVTYADKGESGGAVDRMFCPSCGCPIASRLANGMVAIKVGTLDESAGLSPAVQVWTRSAQGWAKGLITAPGFEQNPPG
ncbi:MAG: aldehyde-activating protein [Alphaproteobacteria bacterium]|nr:aldehyde-activating protein [Alphaproteobacteria bacterium]